jgi:hypothetical protein
VGLTLLDVLLETTQEAGDVLIGKILQRAGRKISEEFNPRSTDEDRLSIHSSTSKLSFFFLEKMICCQYQAGFW